MRKYFVSAFVLAAMLVFATSGLALEKSATRITDGDLGDWNAGTSSCSVLYYNLCTGYVWVWSGWAKNSQFGTVFDTCCDPATDESNLTQSVLRYRTGADPGYGFTGTVAVHAVDANLCPVDPPLASQPILPFAGFNVSLWGIPVPAQFAVVHTVADDNDFVSPIAVDTDGPFACGNCYLTTRTTNSYTWGTTDSPLCPGWPWFDGACEVELRSIAQLVCNTVSVEDESWGSIKNLYR